MRRLSGRTLNTLTRVLIRRRQGQRGKEANTRPEMGRKSNRTCSRVLEGAFRRWKKKGMDERPPTQDSPGEAQDTDFNLMTHLRLWLFRSMEGM